MALRRFIKAAGRKIYRFFRHPKRRRASSLHRWVAERVFDRTLWKPTEPTVARAVAFGLFLSMLPVPGQMLVAGFAVCFLNARGMMSMNLPAAVLSTWINNPVTFGAIFMGQYKLGAWIHETLNLAELPVFPEAQPIIIGVLLTAFAAVPFGYCATVICWDWFADHVQIPAKKTLAVRIRKAKARRRGRPKRRTA